MSQPRYFHVLHSQTFIMFIGKITLNWLFIYYVLLNMVSPGMPVLAVQLVTSSYHLCP